MRLYKAFGVFALVAILIGLVMYVTVNAFYYFNDSWVRPTILTQAHPKVIEATNQLVTTRARLSGIRSEEQALRASIAEYDRAEAVALKFLAEAPPVAAQATSFDQVRLHHEIERADVERINAQTRRALVNQQLADLARRASDEQKRIDQIAATPFARAINGTVTVAFVPYANHSAQPGAPLYACSWGLINCRQVGTVVGAVDGEVQELHPHDQSMHRGVIFEIELSTSSAGTSDVLFSGSKPFWL
ncbi:MAG: hypothetical protein NT062_18985 [Proteobacteria bacterium]|nr:hypothetical protein [Pseudomonadota bacterium]